MADASYGGVGSKNFADNGHVSGGAAGVGRTFIDVVPTNRLLQRGVITSVKYFAHDTVPNGMQFRVYRPVGTNNVAFDFVGASEVFTPVAGSTQTKTLATPITGVLPGDILGYWVDIDGGLSISVGALTTASGTALVRFVAGKPTGTGIDFTVGQLDNFVLPLEAFGIAPDYITTGDSIPAGHGSNYNEYMGGSGPAGDRSAELLYQMEQANASLNGQDYARGSQTWAWVDATAMPAILSGTGVHQSGSANPRAIVLWAGVNDIQAGRTWSQVQTNLDSIFSQAGSIPLIIVDTIPDSNFSDVNAALIRTFNANYRTWATGKSTVAVVTCHDLVGKTRVATGQKDDLADAYNSGDGVHLNAAGEAIIAPLVLAAIGGFFDTIPPSVPSGLTSALQSVVQRITWPASTDNQSDQSHLSYKIFEDGSTSPLGQTTLGITHFDVTRTVGDSHTYKVSALDEFMNESAKSNSISVSFAATSGGGQGGSGTFRRGWKRALLEPKVQDPK